VKIKICGLFHEEDIDYVNEARPDYAGFVFAPSRRQVSAELASRLRRRLAESIIAVGVFIDAPITDIATLYRDGVIGIAQLHGSESEEYIAQLKAESGDTPVPVIQVIKSASLKGPTHRTADCKSDGSRHGGTEENVDYYLLDSGAGSGKPFDWNLLNPPHSLFPPSSFLFEKPWFLAGGIGTDNIEKAMALNPFAIDVSSGAETEGMKDREKILRLTETVRKGNKE
jgi:phosphoribosylanthranilate isomerase